MLVTLRYITYLWHVMQRHKTYQNEHDAASNDVPNAASQNILTVRDDTSQNTPKASDAASHIIIHETPQHS